MSMFNDINLERKDNEDSCALMSRKIKQYASIFFTMDIGHSWGPQRKASGIKDMQPISMASGIFVRHKMLEIFENSGHRVFQV